MASRRNLVNAQDHIRTGILVLGMHRSGTSALARVLSLLGCDLPNTLMEGNEYNERGYWESTRIQIVNDAVLESAGSYWSDWLPFNEDWYSSSKFADLEQLAIKAIEDEFALSSLFVLKDPRICRIVPFWRDVMAKIQIQPFAVIPIRNPLEVANSLNHRDGIEPALGHLIWLRHVLDAEKFTRDIPRIFFSYDGLLDNWQRLIPKVDESVGLKLPRVSQHVADQIDRFLAPEFRHESKSRADVIENPFLSAWLKEAYSIFFKWAGSGEFSGDRTTLDRIRGEFNDASPAFARVILAGQRVSGKSRELETLLKNSEDKLDLKESLHAASLADAEGKLLEADHRLVALQAELSALISRQSELEAQLEVEQKMTINANAEIDKLSEALRAHKLESASALEAERIRSETELRRREEWFAAERDQLKSAAQQSLELKEEVDRSLLDRFNEIAALSRLLAELEIGAEQSQQLREISHIMIDGLCLSSFKGRCLSLMPAIFRVRMIKRKLKRKGIFDADKYMAMNPDVAEARQDPLRHYLVHGVSEGRSWKSFDYIKSGQTS